MMNTWRDYNASKTAQLATHSQYTGYIVETHWLHTESLRYWDGGDLKFKKMRRIENNLKKFKKSQNCASISGIEKLKML